MATVQERYASAIAYVRRAVALVEMQEMFYSVDPITAWIEWYAGQTKTETARNELARIEARWRAADGDVARAKLAREAELLADRVEESLPGAPQNRARTNLYPGEQPRSTGPNTFIDEFDRQAHAVWDWLKEHASAGADGARSLSKWLVVGGGIVASWKLIEYLRAREQRRAPTERQLNANLVRVARDASARTRRAQPLRLHLEDTELHTWFERDRAHVELRDRRTGQTIVEWRDGDVAQAIEDGFLPHFATDTALHRAAFDYAKQVGLIEEARDAGTQRYSLWLTRGEIEALYFLRGRYGSAKAFVDGLVPLDDSADRALGREYDRSDGPYRFQITATDVRKALRATKSDGGNYGAIPNLSSQSVDWVLARERSRVP